ncbi:mycothione reductase [Serinicoccus kebangsaanensis]|uniref:mycothione reductase n=1 Tax=Serinicoccus kebangsaanensis TaxID=2602069 RepID=UPI00124D2E36|nr:mycothione reductase [Serinicoccus kebangsaanensis]
MSETSHYDLVIIGSGSGNSLVTPELEGGRIAVVEEGVFGGTCLNVGCIPTKMFVYAAEVASTIRDAARFGIDATLDQVRWTDIRDRIFGRIDPISDGGRDYRVEGGQTEAFLGHARFVGDHELEVRITRPGGRHEVGSVHRIEAEQIVIATGSSPTIPPAVTEAGVPFHTSDTVMRLGELPASLVILGGGVIAAEFAHIFSALGVAVTIVTRGDGLLRVLDAEVAAAYTDLARAQWTVRTGVEASSVAEGGAGVELGLTDGSVVTGEVLLVATGRAPNTVDLGLEHTGVRTHEDGRVVVDRFGRTDVPGVWSLGDASSEHQLKHVANHEARMVAHNLAHPDDLRAFDHRYVPAAIFSHPQVATVGLTEQEAEDAGHEVTTKVQRYGDTAYGWAMEDTTGILKAVGDVATGQLLGVHAMGPHASTLIQPAIQALSMGPDRTAHELARGQYWIHPAMSEVLENALLGLQVPGDVGDAT